MPHLLLAFLFCSAGASVAQFPLLPPQRPTVFPLQRPYDYGRVFAWTHPFVPIALPDNLSNVVQVAAGAGHYLALRSNGTVYAWGNNGDRQTNVPADATNVVQVAAGNVHSMSLDSGGRVHAWGQNDSRQTSTPTNAKSSVVQIAAGSYHSLALKADGSVVAWGYNGNRQTDVPANLGNVVQIAAGAYHSMALQADGKVLAWGIPTSIAGLPAAAAFGVARIAAGSYHCLALKTDGTVLAWGNPNYLPPPAPTNRTNLVQIAAGNQFNLLLGSDRQLLYMRRGGESNAIATFSNATQIAAFQDIAVALETIDSDGDGLGDGSEIGLHKTDPGKPDTDGDGMPDGWEVSNGFDPRSPSDASSDADADGLSNLREKQLGTAPRQSDTDNDGLPDGQEVDRHRTDPKRGDTDGDTLTDGAEVRLSVLGFSPVVNNTANLAALVNKVTSVPLFTQSQYDAHGTARFSNGVVAAIASLPPVQISLPAQTFTRIAFRNGSLAETPATNFLPAGWRYDPAARDVSGQVSTNPTTTTVLTSVGTSGIRVPVEVSFKPLVSQTITWTNLPATAAFLSNGPVPLRATSSSGLQVTYTSAKTNILQIVGRDAVIKGRGTNTITASHPGNTSYLPASNVVRTIVIK